MTDLPPLPPEARARILSELGLPDTATDGEVYATLGELISDFCKAFAEAVNNLFNDPQAVRLIAKQIRLANDWKNLLTSKAAYVNGWERAKEEISLENDDEDTIEIGDWLWRDAEGRIRRAYGHLGGSHQRALTWDASGACVCGVEARDETGTDAADLADPACVHPKWRAAVETYSIGSDADV